MTGATKPTVWIWGKFLFERIGPDLRYLEYKVKHGEINQGYSCALLRVTKFKLLDNLGLHTALNF